VIAFGACRALEKPFDPASHRRCETRWFEDFALDERFALPSRTMTEAIFLAFQAASGDNHPIHYDVEYCRRRGMPHMLAHGYQVLVQTAAGAGSLPFMMEDSLIGFLEQSSKFLAPVYAGDTVYPMLVIDEMTPGRSTGVIGIRSTVYNQNSVKVMEGRQRYLLRKRPA
jgi:acyl dehydratase